MCSRLAAPPLSAVVFKLQLADTQAWSGCISPMLWMGIFQALLAQDELAVWLIEQGQVAVSVKVLTL